MAQPHKSSGVVKHGQMRQVLADARANFSPPTLQTDVISLRMLAQIVAKGPNDEEDFDDARYWVRQVTVANPRDLQQSAVNDPDYESEQAQLAQVVHGSEDADGPGYWVPATNIAELDGVRAEGLDGEDPEDMAGTHSLPVGTYVEIDAEVDRTNLVPDGYVHPLTYTRAKVSRWWFNEPAALSPHLFRVKSWLDDDHLVCRTWDGDAEGDTDILVAKPWDLRRTPFDGLTVNGIAYTYDTAIRREANDGETTEWQVITPDYYEDAEIYAAKGRTTVVIDETRLSRLSLDTRAWAEE